MLNEKITFNTKAFGVDDIGLSPTAGADPVLIVLGGNGTVGSFATNQNGMRNFWI